MKKAISSILFKIISLAFLLMFSFSCKTRKQETTMADTVTLPEAKMDGAVADTSKIRLIVTFISIGEGTDPEAFEKLNAYIDDFNRDYKVKAINNQIPWGREGEVDNCFLLQNFSPDLQIKFIAGIRELFKDNNLVQVLENQPQRIK